MSGKAKHKEESLRARIHLHARYICAVVDAMYSYRLVQLFDGVEHATESTLVLGKLPAGWTDISDASPQLQAIRDAEPHSTLLLQFVAAAVFYMETEKRQKP